MDSAQRCCDILEMLYRLLQWKRNRAKTADIIDCMAVFPAAASNAFFQA